jgi:hypothetical protein
MKYALKYPCQERAKWIIENNLSMDLLYLDKKQVKDTYVDTEEHIKNT